MPNEEFPTSVVQVHDYTNSLALPGSELFVHFKFKEFPEIECSVIERAVVGADRDAVGKYHRSHPTIEPPKTFSGTSDLGFGPVVVLDVNNKPTTHSELLIMVTSKVPGTSSDRQPRFSPTHMVIARTATELSEPHQQRFMAAQQSCDNGMSQDTRSWLRERTKS